MSAATTIAPALNQMPAPQEQHMRALARANEVRLARAALKREIAAGHRSALEVVREVPWEAESMAVGELLAAQRRWGKARSRKLINSAGLKETKEVGSLTERQRRILAAELEAKAVAQSPAVAPIGSA